MSNVQWLVMAKDEYQAFDHPWNRRATRFLRDLRMLGANSGVIAELLRELLASVEPKHGRREG